MLDAWWTPRARLYAIGSVLLIGSAYRWGIPALAWVAPVPFLLAQRSLTRGRDVGALLAVMALASFIQVAKIITAPLPLMLALPFSLPGAITAWLVLVATEALRRRGGEVCGVIAFASLTGLGEWLSCVGSPLGVWGTAASTQVDNLMLLQWASIFGVPGIGFVMAATSAAFAAWLAGRFDGYKTVASTVVVLLLVVFGFGAWRLDRGTGSTSLDLRVAAVVIDAGPESINTETQRRTSIEDAFARTHVAADRGAQVVVWNEAAVFIELAEEPAFQARVRNVAQQENIDIVAAYAVVLRRSPLSFDNKYIWVTSDGGELETYRKHHPVPGEPSLRGQAPHAVHQRDWGKGAGAICYDYDFPEVALAHARLGADVVFVPSSDWRGIDPYHTQIARLGAIAGGFSLARSVRSATSMAFDAYGRVRSSLPGFGPHERVMLASVPTQRVDTLYTHWGDAPIVAISLIGLAYCLRRSVRAR